MNLHNVAAIANEPEREIDGSCPICGTFRWKRRESGWKVETHYINFIGRFPDENWNLVDDGIEDTSMWKCSNCDEAATDEIDEWIEEHR